MHGEAEMRSDGCRGADSGPRHIGEVLAELLLQLPEIDTEEAARVQVAAWSS